jgi:hypothetical protein
MLMPSNRSTNYRVINALRAKRKQNMEMLIKTSSVSDDQQQYQDGDIVCTLSDQRIAEMHSQRICNYLKAPLTTSGYRQSLAIVVNYLQETSLYRFERYALNATQVRRINLITDEREILSESPNENGEYIHAQEFIKRRLLSPSCSIFGSEGSEYWFGGFRPNPDLNAIWNSIETHSDNLWEDNKEWPFTETEKRHFLPLRCCGGHQGEEEEVISSEEAFERATGIYKIEGEGDEEHEVLVAKRKWFVPYWDLSSELSVDVDTVRNMSLVVDARNVHHPARLDDTNKDKITEGIVSI